MERLRRWQTIKNLVGPSTLGEIWTRHIADSAQLLALAPAARHWVDLGSGAGFPGLVIAIMLAGTADAQVHLIESNQRKCAFLREVARDAGAPAIIHAGRIEEVVPTLAGPLDVVTSRALAPFDQLMGLAGPVLETGALGLFLTGSSDPQAAPGQGTTGASSGWHVKTTVSKTHPTGRIVMVRRSGAWDNG